MPEDKLDQAFATVEHSRRAFLKQLVITSGFCIPMVVSYSVTDLASAQTLGSPEPTRTLTVSVTATT